jgi:glycosyltransferase involved in cell wall biosynthesis
VKSSLFVILPAYNEAAMLGRTLDGLLPLGYSIVVVNDGSTDETRELLTQFPVYELHHPVNLGQGAALQTGIAFALGFPECAWVATFDADGQHAPADLERMYILLQESGADAVLGSRFIPGADTNVSNGRRLLLQLARLVNFAAGGVWLSDAHNGIRLLRRETAAGLRIRENGMAHATEIVVQLRKQGRKILECPVQVMYSRYSQGKGQSWIQSFKIVQDLLLNRLFR